MRRNKFSLSHYRLMSCNMGGLYPIGCLEVLPGDTFQQSTSLLVRCSPLLAPVMHPVRVRVHHWFVPNRLLWDQWEDFITGGPDGNDLSVFPTITPGGAPYATGSLGDHLGLPTGVAGLSPSALPFRAYALIWNECYRDQDLQAKIGFTTSSGVDTQTNRTLQNCDWEKDYFTSARPWEQKGPAITIPLGNTAPVVPTNPQTGPRFNDPTGTAAQHALTMTSGNNTVQWSSVTHASGNAQWGSPVGLQADLTTASGITINRLREAFALQRFEEARARYGSRYVEYLRFLGVRSSDARLSRPEYLGGGKQVIQFSEVLATADTGSAPTNTFVGDMKGHGIGAMRSNRYRRFFEEHGYILSLLSVQPKTMYMQGLNRHWNRRVREDFWQRELQNIGQQEVENREVYAAHTTPTGIFGYQDRYDEYRRQESTVAGEFRTSLLNHWHLARDFSSNPGLNATFVSCVPTERIFADNVEDTLYIMANHSIQARRMVLKTGAI